MFKQLAGTLGRLDQYRHFTTRPRKLQTSIIRDGRSPVTGGCLDSLNLARRHAPYLVLKTDHQ